MVDQPYATPQPVEGPAAQPAEGGGELKACPFCNRGGGYLQILEFSSNACHRGGKRVVCYGCGCVSGGRDTYDADADAIAAWNRRAPAPAPQPVREVTEDAVAQITPQNRHGEYPHEP